MGIYTLEFQNKDIFREKTQIYLTYKIYIITVRLYSVPRGRRDAREQGLAVHKLYRRASMRR